jgi:hypothetical protein
MAGDGTDMAGIGISAAVTLAILVTPGAITPIAAPAADASCTWRLSTVRLYDELAAESDDRSVRLRGLLAASGVADPGFLPDACTSGADGRDTTSYGGGSGGSTADGSGGPPNANPGSDAGSNAGAADSAAGVGVNSGTGSGNCPSTAAATLSWGAPDREDDFTDSSSAKSWGIYDGPGHAGNGRRSPSQVSIANGLLTLTGDAEGNSAGMDWNPGQKYGRWEGCVRSSPGADSLHSLMLLWPDAENWPVGGEVDFMEISDPSRQSVDSFLHYGVDNQQEQSSIRIDASLWHAWAVEWTPQGITQYVDGTKWWSTSDTSHLPPGPMHLCIQLDYFGGNADGGAKETVDWVRQYPVDGSTGNGSPSGQNSLGQSGGDRGSGGARGSASPSDSTG